jgi:hypothetical protein
MTDLTAALREAGHDDLAAALERKALVRGLREAGREDLADALESGETATPPAEEAQSTNPPTPQQQHHQFAEHFRDALNESRTPWFGEASDAA